MSTDTCGLVLTQSGGTEFRVTEDGGLESWWAPTPIRALPVLADLTSASCSCVLELWPPSAAAALRTASQQQHDPRAECCAQGPVRLSTPWHALFCQVL